MTVAVEHQDGVAVVTLSGEIDLRSSPEVRSQILELLQSRVPVVVDLQAVRYIDSSGVASLVEGFQTARSQKLKFVLAGVSPNALRVLKLARLDQVFVIHASLAEAVTAVRAP